MHRYIRASLIAVCLAACLACSACGFAPPDPDAIEILGGIGKVFWFFMLGVPLLTFAIHFDETVQEDHPHLTRPNKYIITLAIGFGLPLLITWPMGGWTGGLFCIGYAVVIGIAHPIYHSARRDSRFAAERLQLETAERLRVEQQERRLQHLRDQIATLPSKDDFVFQFVADLHAKCVAEHLPPIPATNTLYSDVAVALYTSEILNAARVDPTSERYDNVSQLLENFKSPLLNACIEIRRLVKPTDVVFRVSVYDLISKDTVSNVLHVFDWNYSGYHNKIVFPSLLSQLRFNWYNISKKQLGIQSFEKGNTVAARDFEGTPREAAEQYLANTPLLNLFTAGTYFPLPPQSRFEHQWVVAPTGSGKTQLLQTQILGDLEKVKDGASLIIIDSQGMGDGKFLSNIANLKVFAKGQPLDGKLVVLQPDPDHPLALNLFDMGQHSPGLSARDRQILHTSALKMITFCLSGTSDQQQDMIEYMVQLAMVVPNATIRTVRQMLTAKDLGLFRAEFGQALAVVDETVREYFEHTFFARSQTGNVTKEAVLRRIMGMLRNPVFRKMYQNERNKFDMLTEIDAGKVIVINTDVALMGTEACELFGRFFISLLVQATQQRTNKNPVFCYIDEATDYIASDENIASLLDKARKQNVGFILSHQRLAQIRSPNVLDALSNVAIKFAGGNITDASTLAKYMRTTPEFIADQPRLSFAAFVRGQTPQALQVKLEYGKMEAMECMTEGEQRELQASMRERYAVTAASPTAPSSPAKGGVTDVEWEDVVR